MLSGTVQIVTIANGVETTVDAWVIWHVGNKLVVVEDNGTVHRFTLGEEV